MSNMNILTETNKLFSSAISKLGLAYDIAEVLKSPYREIKVEIPVKDSEGNFYLYSGYRIQHNGSRGPYYGGISLDKDLNLEKLISHANRTVCKTALVNIPFGGAYGGIKVDVNNASSGLLEGAVRNYIHKISSLIGPYKDIITQGKNANDIIMACVMDEYSKKFGYSPAVATGKPEALGGTKGRRTALVNTAYYLLDLASKSIQTQLPDMSVAISIDLSQAGYFIEYLNYLNCSLIALSDSSVCIYNPEGFDLEDLKSYIVQNKSLSGYPYGESIPVKDVTCLDVDVLLLGLSETYIDSSNASKVKAKIVLELDDMLIEPDSEEILFSSGVVVIPDLLVTSGEAIVDYFEWIQNIQQFKWSSEQINDEMAKYLNEAFKEITDLTREHQVSYRLACYMSGISRVAEATKLRGYI
ncbi:MAG: Glu/Leu/Phe/Val dehydrogenase dimerization domain-containing protein [Cyanobacteriota bacterium]